MSEGIKIKLEKNSDHCCIDYEAADKNEIEILPTPEKDTVSPAVVSLDIDLDEFGNIRDGQHSDEPINKRQKITETTRNPVENTTNSTTTTTIDTTNIDVTNSNVNGTSTSSQSQPTCQQNQNIPLDKNELDVVEGEILINAKTKEELIKLVNQMTKLPAQKLIQVTDINISTSPEDNLYLKAKQILQISSLSLPQLYSIHFLVNIHESVTAKHFEDLFVKFGETLAHFRLTGGYVGVKKEHFVIRLPPLPKLETFYFQSEYTFGPSYEIDKIVIPGEIIDIGDSDDEEEKVVSESRQANLELFRITIYLPKLKKLRELHLGCYVNVITTDPLKSKDEEFYFDYFENLQVFHVGSPWHKVVKYIPRELQKIEIKLKSLQFPDFLSDPSVIVKIGEEFPKLTEIHLNLPSPEVLQKFFLIFSKIPIQKFYLKTSYLFKETLENILCGSQKMSENEENEKIVWFRKNGKLAGFPTAESRRKRLTGIGGLAFLRTLNIEHIEQYIHFPRFDETLGFKKYLKFPAQDTNLIDQLSKMKKLKHFRAPKVYHENLRKFINSIIPPTHRTTGSHRTRIPKINRLKISLKKSEQDKNENTTNLKKEIVKTEKI